jgi:hypothetical protein
MKTNTEINPKYNFLTQYIEQIPAHFESLTEILYQDRNVIKADEVYNVRLVIKSFHRNYLTNRIRYSFFHPSKAKRAYYNGLEIIKRGFLTPEPVAVLERFEYGLLNQSFFICLRTDFTKLEFHFVTGGDQLMKDLAAFTFDLHRSEIYHLDYSNGNILCKKENDRYRFSLVDNNRMKFGKFSYHHRLDNFRLLGLSHDHLVIVAREYARLENKDQDEAIDYVVRSERKHSERRELRRRLKKKILKRG